jgi:hypothetical protein
MNSLSGEVVNSLMRSWFMDGMNPFGNSLRMSEQDLILTGYRASSLGRAQANHGTDFVAVTPICRSQHSSIRAKGYGISRNIQESPVHVTRAC